MDGEPGGRASTTRVPVPGYGDCFTGNGSCLSTGIRIRQVSQIIALTIFNFIADSNNSVSNFYCYYYYIYLFHLFNTSIIIICQYT